MDDVGEPSAGHPTSAASSNPASHRTDDLVRRWSVTIPRRIESWAPRLADAFADGAWTAIWPRVTAYAPIAALAIGFGVAVLLPLLPGDYGSFSGVPRVWSELLPFMTLVIAAGILSGTAGIGLLAGYIAGDVLWLAIGPMIGEWARWYVLNPNPLIAGLEVAASALITYLLLAIPAITLPMIARDFAARAPLRWMHDRRLRMVARAGVYLVTAGLLTFFWTRAVVVLMRPLFTWRSGSPVVQAIEPVQFQWEWLVGAAIVAVMLRVVLQEVVVRRSTRSVRIGELQAQRWAGAAPGAFWRRAGPLPRIALIAATVTLLLAGTYEDVIDPVVVLVATALAVAWRAGLMGAAPAAWVARVERIPAVVRLAVALGFGYLLARILLEVWTGDSLRPVLIGILLIGAVFVILFPTRAGARRAQQAAGAP